MLTLFIKVGAVLLVLVGVALFRKRLSSRKIQDFSPGPEVRRHEIRYALWTVGVTAVVGLVTSWALSTGALVLPTSWPPVRAMLGEIVLFVLLFDAYFYGLHRLLHTDWLYRHVHAVHHRSTAPNAVTALAFHPVEAFLLVAFFPVGAWALSMHLPTLALATAFLSMTITLAHCGFEMFPRWWHTAPLLRLYVTPLVHDHHHTAYTANYGASLTLFDRLFGTYELDVPGFYDLAGGITGRSPAGGPSPPPAS